MRDGHINNCKTCHNERSSKWNKENKDRINENNRKRAKTDAVKTARKKIYTSEKGRAVARAAVKRYREKKPMVDVAHTFVRLAIKSGLMKKEPKCSLCASENRIEAHHDNYAKPEIVRWLCKACHEEWHRTNKPIYEEIKKEEA